MVKDAALAQHAIKGATQAGGNVLSNKMNIVYM